ncbi:MAG: carbohydrate-binding protein [Verrucomicrobia bacterium]|nr:carbohydrate-binding protein [Verrucomicrobiota bacterium]
MKLLTLKLTSEPFGSTQISHALRILAVALLASLFSTSLVLGQAINDNFDTGTDVGWQHYTPTTAGGAVPTYTFPPSSSGGLGYRHIYPPLTCQGLLQRGYAYRSEQYGTFSYSVDMVNWKDDFASTALFGFRVGPPGTLAPLSAQGCLTALTLAAPPQRQAVFLNLVAFSSEILSTVVDAYRGGGVLCSVFPPSRPLRIVCSGTNEVFKSEIYDRSDLLEPLVRISFQDFVHCIATDQSSTPQATGENILGGLNLDDGDLGLHHTVDITFDNYSASSTFNAPKGFPGVAQVVDLKPAAQALFYQPPGIGSNITFKVTTLTAANQINTNSLKLSLNGTNVLVSQLVITELAHPLPTDPTDFSVRYNGPLTSNTIYHGQIIVLDTGGKGTTNNWYFDTFTYFNPTDTNNPSGFLLVEAEDYNYGGGMHQDYPPVSGTDDTTLSEDPVLSLCDGNPQETIGPQVKGGGLGYYNGYDYTPPPGTTVTPHSDIVGSPDIDYHDSGDARTRPQDILSRHQYRSSDVVGTVQGTKGGGYDTPRPYRMGLTNANGGTSYVPDYIVADIQPGDWMNYTRNFPNSGWNVYLRVSSEGAQAVRFDQVTGDITQSNQPTALKGQFLVPNTESWTRWRYVPLTDAAGNLQTLALNGTNTLRLTANEVRVSETGVTDTGDLQLNWMLFVPTNGAPSSGPWIASAQPAAKSENFHPAGTVKIVILDRGTAVVPGSIQLRFDGVNVTGSSTITNTTTEGAGATVSYVPGLLLPKSTHNLSVVYGDGSTTQSNYWTFKVDNVALLTPADGLAGSPDTNFTVDLHKATNGDPATCSVTLVGPDGSQNNVTLNTFGNNIARAERQLAGLMINSDTQSPFVNEADTNGGTAALTFTAPVINFDQCGGVGGGAATDRGFFQDSNGFPDTNYPGLYPSLWCNGDYAVPQPDHFAISASIKLYLPAGIYRMGVNSDDQFAVKAGGANGTNVYIASSQSYPGTRGDGQFEFVIQNTGVYKFRLFQEEGDGDADCEWYWVDRTTGVRTLITPTPVPSVSLFSCTTVNGSYTNDLTGVIDTGTKTVTVLKSGNTRFYKLSAGSALNITNVTLSGGNVVLKYQ